MTYYWVVSQLYVYGVELQWALLWNAHNWYLPTIIPAIFWCILFIELNWFDYSSLYDKFSDVFEQIKIIPQNYNIDHYIDLLEP